MWIGGDQATRPGVQPVSAHTTGHGHFILHAHCETIERVTAGWLFGRPRATVKTSALARREEADAAWTSFARRRYPAKTRPWSSFFLFFLTA